MPTIRHVQRVPKLKTQCVFQIQERKNLLSGIGSAPNDDSNPTRSAVSRFEQFFRHFVPLVCCIHGYTIVWEQTKTKQNDLTWKSIPEFHHQAIETTTHSTLESTIKMQSIGKRIQMLLATALLLCVGPAMVSASRDNTLSAQTLTKYWTDARDVLENLNDYQALWIKVHGCV